MKKLDYYFYGMSPYAYIGHQKLLTLAQKHTLKICYKPVNLKKLWQASGGVPLAKRPPVRQRYRLVELERCAKFRGLEINIEPRYFPVDCNLADLCTIAITETGANPAQYLTEIFTSVWARDENISDKAVILKYLDECGFNGKQMIELAQTEGVINLRDTYSQEAVQADAVGVPAYVVDNNVFWGQDRLEYLDFFLSAN